MRPIGDFLITQGTFCSPGPDGSCQLYAPPVPNQLAWMDQAKDEAIWVDYTGMGNGWYGSQPPYQPYGTQVNGTIMEQMRPDGSVMVTVDLQSSKAMGYIVRGRDLRNPAMAGYQVPELVDGKTSPMLGNATLHLMYVNRAPGLPVPDLNQLILAPEPGQQLVDVRFNYDADGTMRDGGTPVHVVVGQNGSFMLAYPDTQLTGPMGMATIDMSKPDYAVAVD